MRLCAPTLSPRRFERLLGRRLGRWQYESRGQAVGELELPRLRARTGAVAHYDYQLPRRENIDPPLSRYSEKADLVELRCPFGCDERQIQIVLWLSLQHECACTLLDPDPIERTRIEHLGADEGVGSLPHEQNDQVLRAMRRHVLAVAHGAEKIATDRGGIDHGRMELECGIFGTCARLAAMVNPDSLYRTSRDELRPGQRFEARDIDHGGRRGASRKSTRAGHQAGALNNGMIKRPCTHGRRADAVDTARRALAGERNRGARVKTGILLDETRELRTQGVVVDDRLGVLHEDDANDLSLQIQSDYEVERRTGEADDICQFIGREQKADGGPGAVNRYDRRLSGRWAGVGRLWEQATNPVLVQPVRLLPRTHRSGDTEERETYQEDERPDGTRAGKHRRYMVLARLT